MGIQLRIQLKRSVKLLMKPMVAHIPPSIVKAQVSVAQSILKDVWIYCVIQLVSTGDETKIIVQTQNATPSASPIQSNKRLIYLPVK